MMVQQDILFAIIPVKASNIIKLRLQAKSDAGRRIQRFNAAEKGKLAKITQQA
jgi:hypothetical protein